jgi:hypothetical protein
MKKFLCVIVAVVIALSSITIIASAATPNISMTVDNTGANPGDIITVTVKAASGSNLAVATLNVVYDNTCFALVEGSLTATDAMDATLNEKFAENKVRYVGCHIEYLGAEAVLFTVQFKVLKRGGSISIEAEQVVAIEKNFIMEEEKNFTNEVNDSFKDDVITLACPHTNKTTYTVDVVSCTQQGKNVERCDECGMETEIIVEMLPHDMQNVVIKPATCKEAGKECKKCSVCGFVSDEKEIPALDHDLKEFVNVEPTCEKDGVKTQVCNNCDYISEEIAIPATGHSEGVWIVTKLPTKESAGLEEKKCTTCGKTLESREIPKIEEYKLGDVNRDGYVTAVDARYVLQSVAGLREFTSVQKLAGDMNKDGQITAVDSRMILQIVAGIAKF